MKKMTAILGLVLISSTVFEAALAEGSSCVNPSELTLDGQVKMKFCDISDAKGVMIGSENGWRDEKPVKARNFKKFQMAQFEVTQLQYRTVTGVEPWKGNVTLKSFVQENNDNPAVYVSYNDAQQFVRSLNLIDRTATYRLPTEAEFEYAARAGTTTNYYWGDMIDANYVYYSGNTKTTGEYARKVDSCPNAILNQKYPGYCANDFGLYHMLGNVMEWTADAYHRSYHFASTDGNVAVEGEVTSSRVVRGGSWSQNEGFGSANRRELGPSNRYSDVGFRLVRTAK